MEYAAVWTDRHGHTIATGDTVMWARTPRLHTTALITGVCPATGRPVIAAASLWDTTTDTHTVPAAALARVSLYAHL